MNATAAAKTPAWHGPVILSGGFRPLLLGAALWTCLSMIAWALMMSGHLVLPLAIDPVSWHAHEFLFGYLGAVIAGFLLTAVPNWTGRPPLVGRLLGVLALLWLVGRLVIVNPAGLSGWQVAAIDLAFPLLLAVTIAREILASRNWRNLIVLTMLVVFIGANALFHWEAAQGAHAAQGMGARLGLATAVMMIAVIGGRIIPSFTRNWLQQRGDARLPVSPMQHLDKLSLVVLLVALSLWLLSPFSKIAAIALAFAGLLHAIRLSRWAGHRTLAEPLLSVLHAGYAFLPLGALALAFSILMPFRLDMATAQHLWMTGAIGLMTLAVMTRATLGHTGQPLTASRATNVLLCVADHGGSGTSCCGRVARQQHLDPATVSLGLDWRLRRLRACLRAAAAAPSSGRVAAG